MHEGNPDREREKREANRPKDAHPLRAAAELIHQPGRRDTTHRNERVKECNGAHRALAEALDGNGVEQRVEDSAARAHGRNVQHRAVRAHAGLDTDERSAGD